MTHSRSALTSRALAVGTLAFGVLWAAPLAAGQVREDFAFGVTVEPEAAGPLVELPVPEVVYDSVTRPDLGDLRVFNRDGVVVPHAVRRPQARVEEGPGPRALPFFPLRDRAGATGRALRIVTDDRGAIVSAIREAVRPGDARVAAYLVDASALEQALDALTLEWTGVAADGFAVNVTVEASDDLARWRVVASGMTLAELRSGGAELVHRTIDLPPTDARYLRIEWPERLGAVRLTGVEASFPRSTQPLVRETARVPGMSIEGEPGVYEFDTGGVRPVDQIRLLFEDANTVADGALLSRARADEAWRRRYEGTFYRLEQDGASLESEPAGVTVTPDRYWRLERTGESAEAGRPPTLELGWTPDVLTVVAQGEGPFTVAFGSATVEPADRAAEGLLTVIEDSRTRALVASAQASAVFTLGGAEKLEPPRRPLPWRTWVLWGVLVAGVGVLGWMVRQLIGRMHG